MVSSAEQLPDDVGGTPSVPPHLLAGRVERFQPARIRLREQHALLDPHLPVRLARELSLSHLLARVLACRGISTTAEAREFLSPTLKDGLPDPTQMKNIQEAVDLILDFVRSGKLITVYCDFDVDGLTGGAQLFLFLQHLRARVNVYVPNRFTEGYGLVESAVEKLALAGTSLLIVIDCGITNDRELALARRRGMKTIVIDHHLPHALPPADVIVDPAQGGCPFEKYALCAAGLVFMVLIVLRQQARVRFEREIANGSIDLPDPKEFLDLAVLGTVCDMVPLTGVNRVIAHRGLEALRKTDRPGLVALKRVANLVDHRLTAGNIAFQLGPRINAAGRLEDASAVLELLTTSSESRANSVASTLNRLNSRRRSIEQCVLNECLQRIKSDALPASAPALILYDEGFHSGVIGIVAQRLVEQFYRPSVVMAPGELLIHGKMLRVIKGSIRGIRGFHVAKALDAIRDTLVNGGGHAEAGGFSIRPENLERFREAFQSVAHEQLTEEMLKRELVADVEAPLREVDLGFALEVTGLGPFGVGNPTPVIVSHNLTIKWVQSISEDHLRLRVGDGNCARNMVAWRYRGHPLLRKGERVSVAYCPEINTYNGVSSLQLNLREVWVA